MTQPKQLTVDDVLDLEMSGRSHAEIVETLVEWSTAASADGGDDPPTGLLVSAAEHLLPTRYHMRRRQGANVDGYDREAAEILADRRDDD